MDTAIVSGPGRQLAAIVRPLAGLGIDVTPVLIRRRGWRSHPFADFLDARSIRYETLSDRGPLDPRPLGQLRGLMRERQPHIVQTHGYRPTVMVRLLRRSGQAWRWVGFHHGRTTESAKVRLYHHLDLALLPGADQAVVIAGTQLRHFRRPQDVLVVANAVLDEVQSSPVQDDETVLAENLPRPWIGVIGRLSPEKGVDVFLRALRELSFPGTAVIAGAGQEEAALKQLAASLGLRHVAFLGQVADPGSLYPRLDLVVLPSRTEGLPNTLLEALRAGRRVVASRVGAVPEVVDSEEVGLVVPPDDPTALAAGISRALLMPETGATRAARERVLDRYSLTRRVQAHVELYRRLVG